MHTNRHFPELDGIRGMAILLILVFHCVPLGVLPFNEILASIKLSCWIGVDLFFVLSGFLITKILIGLKRHSKKYTVFYGRRSLRIFPLYYLSLVIIFFLLIHKKELEPWISFSAPKEWFFLYGYNIYVMVNNSWATSNFLNHYWSLCIEEQFYIFWPFIIFNMPTRKLPLAMIVIISLSLITKVIFYFMGMSWPVIYTSTLARMDCFALGGLSAYGFVFWDKKKAIYVIKGIFYTSLVLLISYGAINRGIHTFSFFTLVVITPILALFFSTLLYLVITDNMLFLKFAFSASWLRLLGKYSYGIYIYHWPLYVSIVRVDAFGLNIKNLWVSSLLAVSTTLTVSIISYHLVEQHFLRAKKYFNTKVISK